MAHDKQLVLKVSEAQSRDVGKAVVRIDLRDMQRLGIPIGGVVEIRAKSSAYARAMPAYDELRGKSLIQMDGLLRRNAGVGLDENITAGPAAAEDAQAVVLSGAGTNGAGTEDMKFLKLALDGIPVIAGNLVRAKPLGVAAREFVVVETKPDGLVRITKDTAIKVKSEGAGRRDSHVAYEDIGGLEKQIQRIREMIELPLRYPELFSRLGIDAPKGVLLFGPPGTGKTLIAKAVAGETNASFFHVNGPEIINKFYGESEAKLRDIFETAKKNAPSIIFLDEIDAISPKRENTNGDVEKRVVAQLLSLMDGINERGQVIVIGATNIPNAIDPALRRPGRFDREIEIGIPDKNGRLKILQIHTRDMPLDGPVDLPRLAGLTHGYVGADLQSLCREAAMSALRKILPQIDLSAAAVPYDVLENLKVTMDDFMGALNEIEPSAIREVFIEIPNVRFDDIGGLNDIKDKIRESIVWPELHKELFDAFGCRAPRGIMFYGAPGTGKTLLARAIASLNNANFISVKGPALLSKWVGESEKGLRDIFKKAKQAAPCVVFFDEIDALVPVRGSRSDATESLLCQLLAELDGIEELKGVTVIAATNRLDIIDPALLRPGRFGLLLEFKPPDFAGRVEIFNIHLSGRPLAEDVDVARLARLTEGRTGAEIMEICQRASLGALSELLAASGAQDGGMATRAIRLRDFLKAMGEGA